MTEPGLSQDTTTSPQAAFRRVDRSVSLLRANFLMVYFALPSVVLLGGVFVLVWGATPLLTVLTGGYTTSLIVLLVGILVHEAIHGLTWKISTGKPFGVITFGFDWKTITPYAHCSEAMPVNDYRLGAVMPLIVLGIVPSLFAIAGGQGGLMVFGLFFTFAAGGDMLILWLLRDVSPPALVEDHPSQAGCYVLEPEEQQ
ncbi:MAG: DUF3267 domain-containing protein [Bacteroidetes bacterium]|nr:DUF3267 domain-containing protein [Bacteroidota bacterium]